MSDKFYLHPVNMTEMYLDNNPTRDPVFALSPKPDTVGAFNSKQDAELWVENRRKNGFKSGIEIVQHDQGGQHA